MSTNATSTASSKRTITLPASVNAAMSTEELFDALFSMSATVSWTTILDDVSKLPSDENTEKIGVLSASAASGVKDVTQAIASATAIDLPAAFLTGDSINFTAFAMTGHLLFLLPDADLTVNGRKFKATYSKSIGGAKSIASFGANSVVAGKPVRTAILKEWSEKLKDADVSKVRKVFSDKFPFLVRPSAFISNSWNPFSYLSYLLFDSWFAFGKFLLWQILLAPVIPFRIGYRLGKPLGLPVSASILAAWIISPYRALALAVLERFLYTASVLLSYALSSAVYWLVFEDWVNAITSAYVEHLSEPATAALSSASTFTEVFPLAYAWIRDTSAREALETFRTAPSAAYSASIFLFELIKDLMEEEGITAGDL